MKKIYKNLVFFILSLCILFGCTKDINIQDQFDYDVNLVIADSGYVYEPTAMDLKIVPKNFVKGTDYKISYKIENGGAYLETGKPTTTIKKDDVYKMPETRQQSFKFYPTTVGVNKILISIEDNNGLIKK